MSSSPVCGKDDSAPFRDPAVDRCLCGGENQPGRVRVRSRGCPVDGPPLLAVSGVGDATASATSAAGGTVTSSARAVWTECTSRDGPNGWSRADPQRAESEVVRLTWGAPLGTSALRLRPGGGRCSTRLLRGRGPESYARDAHLRRGRRLVEVADLAACGVDVLLVADPVGTSWGVPSYAGSTDPDPLAPKQRVGVRTRARLAHGGTGRQALDSRPQRELWAEPLMALRGRFWGCGRESIRREAYLQAQAKWRKRERAASERHSSRLPRRSLSPVADTPR